MEAILQAAAGLVDDDNDNSPDRRRLGAGHDDDVRPYYKTEWEDVVI